MISKDDLKDLCVASAVAGHQVDGEKLILLSWDAGDLHRPERLRDNYAAVYIFEYEGKYLKVGKVNSKSNARYQFQHYLPDSCRSNLARSLQHDKAFQTRIGCGDVGEWMKANTTRYNILIPVEYGKQFVHFAEAFFILKCCPRFED